MFDVVHSNSCSAASETESPRRNITKAVQRVFYRIALFYVNSCLPVLKVCYSLRVLDKRSWSTNSVFPHIINACVFTSAFSAGNSLLFCGSRILYGLALRGQAPKIFTYCTRNGLPIVAVLLTVSTPRGIRLINIIVIQSSFTLLSFMSVKSGSETVFL